MFLHDSLHLTQGVVREEGFFCVCILTARFECKCVEQREGLEEQLLENRVQAPLELSATLALQALLIWGRFPRLFQSKHSGFMQICCFNSSNSPACFNGAGSGHVVCFREKMGNGSRIWEVPTRSQLCPQTSCDPDVAG